MIQNIVERLALVGIAECRRVLINYPDQVDENISGHLFLPEEITSIEVFQFCALQEPKTATIDDLRIIALYIRQNMSKYMNNSFINLFEGD